MDLQNRAAIKHLGHIWISPPEPQTFVFRLILNKILSVFKIVGKIFIPTLCI